MSLSKVSEVLFIHGKFTKIGYNRKVGKMTELTIYTRTLMMSTILRFPEQKNPQNQVKVIITVLLAIDSSCT